MNALFNPETSILIQKRHPYLGNLNSETSGDSKNALLDFFLMPLLSCPLLLASLDLQPAIVILLVGAI